MAKAPKQDRVSRISDPRQRVVASRVGEICDIFHSGFAAFSPMERLVDRGRATTPEKRVLSAARMYALGGVVRLGRELGLPMHALHGLPRAEAGEAWPRAKASPGCTQIEELKGLHRTTCHKAEADFAALMSDPGEFGALVAARFSRILRGARAEAARLVREEEAAEAARSGGKVRGRAA